MREYSFLPATILGVALIASAAIFGGFYQVTQSTIATKDTLSVVGSAKARVVSDQAKLTLTVSRVAPIATLSSGYGGVSHDTSLVQELLTKEHVVEKDIVESPIFMNQVYDQNASNELRYQLTQTITVQSSDVENLTKISKKIPLLAAQGAIVSVQSLEYFYTKLPEMRVSLLSEAVKDAHARAEKIAEATGRVVGHIQSASNGVVQVMSPNSIDISDYGSYDTSSIEKDVMVVVKASFQLR